MKEVKKIHYHTCEERKSCRCNTCIYLFVSDEDECKCIYPSPSIDQELCHLGEGFPECIEFEFDNE